MSDIFESFNNHEEDDSLFDPYQTTSCQSGPDEDSAEFSCFVPTAPDTDPDDDEDPDDAMPIMPPAMPDMDDPDIPHNFTGSTKSVSFPSPMSVKMSQPDDDFDPLSILINYNEKFAKADPCLFRDELISQTISVLISKNKPNALLVGSAGVGKTKIAEEIARLLANKSRLIPNILQGYTIYELPIASIVSGSCYVGDVEKKIQKTIEFLCDPINRAICFIDEIHVLYGSDPSYTKIAQIIKPELARGGLRTIGSTTLQESASLTKDPAFSRRFKKLQVDELTAEQTVKILDAVRPGMYLHYGCSSASDKAGMRNDIRISDDLLPVIVRIADKFSQAGSHRPDNAITLMDHTMAEAVVARHQHLNLHPEDANGPQLIVINERAVELTAFRQLTGHSKSPAPDPKALREALSAIKGQDSILDPLTKLMCKHFSPYFSSGKPLALLFAGYSGTGKTETAKILARELVELKPIILNMTEYRSCADINKIIGSPAGYVGSDSNAELPFDSLESNPYQVILLDEFEKCDPAVQTLFMSVFDEGSLRKSNGQMIDFSKSIIIATTNAAHTGSDRRKAGITAQSSGSRERSVKALSESFPIELLNRFEEIFEFNKLPESVYREILQSVYKREAARLKKDFKRDRKIRSLADELAQDELDRLCETTYTEAFGGRPANAAVRRLIEEKLSA